MYVITQQSPNPVIIASEGARPTEKHKTAFNIVGTIQFVAGVATVIIAAIYNPTSIPVGILFGATGAAALSSARAPTRCILITGMVLSILSAIASGGALIATAMLLPLYSYYYTISPLAIALFVLYSIMVIAAITHSAYCCAGSCCKTRNQSRPVVLQPQPVLYYPQSNAQMGIPQMATYPQTSNGGNKIETGYPSFNTPTSLVQTSMNEEENFNA